MMPAPRVDPKTNAGPEIGIRGNNEVQGYRRPLIARDVQDALPAVRHVDVQKQVPSGGVIGGHDADGHSVGSYRVPTGPDAVSDWGVIDVEAGQLVALDREVAVGQGLGLLGAIRGVAGGRLENDGVVAHGHRGAEWGTDGPNVGDLVDGVQSRWKVLHGVVEHGTHARQIHGGERLEVAAGSIGHAIALLGLRSCRARRVLAGRFVSWGRDRGFGPIGSVGVVLVGGGTSKDPGNEQHHRAAPPTIRGHRRRGGLASSDSGGGGGG